MPNAQPQIWWPLLRRMLGWGLVMAFLWGWFPFVFGGEVGVIGWFAPHLLESPPAPEDVDPDADWGDAILVVLGVLALIITAILAFFGLVAGLLAGYYAPPSEPKNPLQSTFFRSVGRTAFWFWFWSHLALSVCNFLLTFLMPNLEIADFGFREIFIWATVVLQVALPPLSIWRALNQALNAVPRQSELGSQTDDVLLNPRLEL